MNTLLDKFNTPQKKKYTQFFKSSVLIAAASVTFCAQELAAKPIDGHFSDYFNGMTGFLCRASCFSSAINYDKNIIRFGALDEIKVLNTTDDANTSFSTNAADITLDGFITGPAKDVTIKSGCNGESLVEFFIGNQSVVGTVKHGTSFDIYASAQDITFTSSGNPSNKITLKIAATGVDLSDTNKIENQLKAILGINQGAPISLRSGSTALPTISSATAGASTKAGVFGVSYAFDKVTYKVTYSLTDGNATWTKEFDAETLRKDRKVPFDNGLTIRIAAGTNEEHSSRGFEMLQVQ